MTLEPTEIIRSDTPAASVRGPWADALANRALGSGSASSGSEAERVLGLIRFTIARWWKIATPCGLVLALIGGLGVWCLKPPSYAAVAWVKIEDRKPVLAFPDSDGPLMLKTQIELIKSPIVLEPVVRQPEVAQLPIILAQKAPVEWLAKRLTIKSVGGSELYHIGVEGPDPSILPQLVNAIVESYLRIETDLTGSQTQRTLELLDQEMRRRTLEMNRLQQNLKELTRRVTGKDPSLINVRDTSAMQSTYKPLESLNDRLANTEVELQGLESDYKVLEELLAQKDLKLTPKEIARIIDQDPTTTKLRTEIAMLEAKLLDEKRFGGMGEGHPSYQRRKADLQRARLTLDEHCESLSAGAGEELQQIRRQEQEVELAQLRSQLNTRRALRDRLKEQLKQQQEELRALGDHSLEVDFARAELTREETVYQRIADRAVVLRTELRAPGRVSALKSVRPADVYVSKNPLKYMFIVVLAGLGSPFGVAFVWERHRRRIADAEQGQQESQLPVIAEVSCMPPKSSLERRRSPKEERQWAMFEESINLLRIGLTMPAHLADMSVLTVASAISGEGKSSIASQLALSLSRISPKPVLLIDADLRSPTQHKLFEMRQGPGLCEVLEGECQASDAVVVDRHSGLHVLPAGQLRKNPHVLLTTEAFQRLLGPLRASYQYVIIDSPPLLVAGEAFVLAKAADGTLMCAMRDWSRGPQVRYACERLSATGVRPLGLVLNGVPASEYASRYSGNYYVPAQSLERSS